jgi:hypothetical protein
MGGEHRLVRHQRQILWVPRGEHGEHDFPKVKAPPVDPDNRKKEW